MSCGDSDWIRPPETPCPRPSPNNTRQQEEDPNDTIEMQSRQPPSNGAQPRATSQIRQLEQQLQQVLQHQQHYEQPPAAVRMQFNGYSRGMNDRRRSSGNFSNQPSLRLSQRRRARAARPYSLSSVGEMDDDGSIYAEPTHLLECCLGRRCSRPRSRNNNRFPADTNHRAESDSAAANVKTVTLLWGYFKTAVFVSALLISTSVLLIMGFKASGLEDLIFRGSRPDCVLVDSLPTTPDVTHQEAKPLMGALMLKPKTPKPKNNTNFGLISCLQSFEDAGLSYTFLKKNLDNTSREDPYYLLTPPSPSPLDPELERKLADDPALDECARRFSEVGSSYFVLKSRVLPFNRTQSFLGRNDSTNLGHVWSLHRSTAQGAPQKEGEEEIEPNANVYTMAIKDETKNCSLGSAGDSVGGGSSTGEEGSEDAEDEEIEGRKKKKQEFDTEDEVDEPKAHNASAKANPDLGARRPNAPVLDKLNIGESQRTEETTTAKSLPQNEAEREEGEEGAEEGDPQVEAGKEGEGNEGKDGDDDDEEEREKKAKKVKKEEEKPKKKKKEPKEGEEEKPEEEEDWRKKLALREERDKLERLLVSDHEDDKEDREDLSADAQRAKKRKEALNIREARMRFAKSEAISTMTPTPKTATSQKPRTTTTAASTTSEAPTTPTTTTTTASTTSEAPTTPTTTTTTTSTTSEAPTAAKPAVTDAAPTQIDGAVTMEEVELPKPDSGASTLQAEAKPGKVVVVDSQSLELSDDSLPAILAAAQPGGLQNWLMKTLPPEERHFENGYDESGARLEILRRPALLAQRLLLENPDLKRLPDETHMDHLDRLDSRLAKLTNERRRAQIMNKLDARVTEEESANKLNIHEVITGLRFLTRNQTRR